MEFARTTAAKVFIKYDSFMKTTFVFREFLKKTKGGNYHYASTNKTASKH